MPSARLPLAIFLPPTLQIAPRSTLGWIHLCLQCPCPRCVDSSKREISLLQPPNKEFLKNESNYILLCAYVRLSWELGMIAPQMLEKCQNISFKGKNLPLVGENVEKEWTFYWTAHIFHLPYAFERSYQFTSFFVALQITDSNRHTSASILLQSSPPRCCFAVCHSCLGQLLALVPCDPACDCYRTVAACLRNPVAQ